MKKKISISIVSLFVLSVFLLGAGSNDRVINAFSVIFNEPFASGSNKVTLETPALSSDYTLTLPTEQGYAGSVLANDGSGNLLWGDGGGAGGINYIDNYDAEDGTTTGWVAYSDGGATPTDGTGGSPTATLTNTTSTPLRGTRSFLYTSGAQGNGVSYDFTIDAADKNKAIYVSFDYSTSGYTTDDLKFYIYDVTGTTMTELRGSASNGHATFIFYAGSNTSYRFVAHQTTANSFTFKFDNVRVGPDEIIDGPIKKYLGELTTTGTWTTNTTYTGRYWRDDDWLVGSVTVKTSGRPTAGLLEVSLPSGLTIDTNKLDITASERYIFSSGRAREDGVGNYPIAGVYATTTALGLQTFGISTHTGTVPIKAYSTVTDTAPFNFDINDSITFSYRVPILEWANETALLSTSKMMNETVAAKYYLSASTVTGAISSTSVVVDFDSSEYDTHGAVTTGAAWKFTAPTAGRYSVKALITYSYTGTDFNGTSEYADLIVRKNGTNFQYLETRRPSNGEQYPLLSGSLTLLLEKGDYIDLTTRQNSGVAISLLEQQDLGYVAIERLPDLSVYGAPWFYGLETATSSPFSLSTATYATGEYAQMSGNSVTLTEGVWKLSGGSKFIPGGSTASLIIALWSLANGDDTTSAPTSISSVLTSGNDTMTYEPIGGFTVTKPMSEIVVTVTSETTVYLNHYVVFSVAGTASVTSYITAQRIRQ